MSYEILKPHAENGIMWCCISRPEAMNALNSLFFKEMDHFLKSLGEMDDVQLLVLYGDGKAFVAGADIQEMQSKVSQQAYDFSRMGQSVFSALENLDIPVIGMVNGFALGGGLELAMACDFRIASEKAKFGQPEVNLGLIPGFAGTQRLSRLTTLGDALWLLMTAEMIDAPTALRIGLVQKVVAHDELKAEVEKMATTILQKGPLAIKKVKKVCRKGYESAFTDGEELEADHFSTLFGPGTQGEEGMAAFLEKRKPNW